MIFPIPGGKKIGSHYLPRYTRYRVIAGRVIKGGHCSPIVLIRVHLVQIYTTDGAMCHAMFCKHSSSTGIPARAVIFGIAKKIRTVIR